MGRSGDHYEADWTRFLGPRYLQPFHLLAYLLYSTFAIQYKSCWENLMASNPEDEGDYKSLNSVLWGLGLGIMIAKSFLDAWWCSALLYMLFGTWIHSTAKYQFPGAKRIMCAAYIKSNKSHPSGFFDAGSVPAGLERFQSCPKCGGKSDRMHHCK
ncbi:hypothetical protein BJ170DRAFT_710447 [Xylariales sp. AK1849]|nr:hypothetical protein BJ170DRAFT_710447 [Xylariales sp. AK1849]